MSITQTAANDAQRQTMPTGAPPPAGSGLQTEASLLPRFVALLTPVFAILSGWAAAWVAQHTGAKLDQTQVVSFMVAAGTAALGAAWKWLQGWQQHEQRVADGTDIPRRSGPSLATH